MTAVRDRLGGLGPALGSALGVGGVVVDAERVVLPRRYDEPIDLLFGEHRVWSFNPAQDGRPHGRGSVVPWPAVLRARLRGVAEVTVVPHAEGSAPLFTGTVHFGGGDQPLRLVDDLGNPLSLDKGGHLQRTFDRFDPQAREELVDATRRVLDDLNGPCGLTAFLAYGCLLGAVRDGHMIGHDSDSDVAFLSQHTHPFDIIRETRRAEQQMRDLGWQVVRMSAANFKVWVPLSSGKRAGVDVFGSFHVGPHYYLTGSLKGRLPREAIVPLGEVTLEGVPLAAPADPEAMLAYCYGPGWRVPDPSFRFLHPPENTRIMSAWLRGTRRRHKLWETFYTSPAAARVPAEPSAFAAWAGARMDHPARVLELGTGTGRDALWFAGQGDRVVATDRAFKALTSARERARKAGVKVTAFRSLNLESTHQVLTWGTALARTGSPYDVYARGLIDALDPGARPNLWRLCSMAGRRGGHTFLEFRTPRSRRESKAFGPHERTFAEPAAVVAEIEAAGGRVTERVVARGLAVLGEEDPEICRLVVDWSRARTPEDPA